MKIKIYGASDDLIEIVGDIEEEFRGIDHAYLAISDGTLLKIRYSEERIWRITPIFKGESVLSKETAVDTGSANYSDVVTIEGAILWVALSQSYVDYNNNLREIEN